MFLLVVAWGARRATAGDCRTVTGGAGADGGGGAMAGAAPGTTTARAKDGCGSFTPSAVLMLTASIAGVGSGPAPDGNTGPRRTIGNSGSIARCSPSDSAALHSSRIGQRGRATVSARYVSSAPSDASARNGAGSIALISVREQPAPRGSMRTVTRHRPGGCGTADREGKPVRTLYFQGTLRCAPPRGRRGG